MMPYTDDCAPSRSKRCLINNPLSYAGYLHSDCSSVVSWRPPVIQDTAIALGYLLNHVSKVLLQETVNTLVIGHVNIVPTRELFPWWQSFMVLKDTWEVFVCVGGVINSLNQQWILWTPIMINMAKECIYRIVSWILLG